MEHPRIDDEKILDRYLVGQLSPQEEELFEEHLFSCAECLEKAQWGEQLRRGLRAVAVEDAARAAVSAGIVAWLRRRRAGQLAGLMGLALSLLLAIVVLPTVMLRQRAELDRLRATTSPAPVQQGSAPGFDQPLGDLAVVTMGTVRDGGGEPVAIRPDPRKEAILLSLELPTVAAARYRVTLRDAAGEILWSGDDLEPTLYDTLVVLLPTSFLAPGEYRIDLEALSVTGAEPAGEMVFRVLPPQSPPIAVPE